MKRSLAKLADEFLDRLSSVRGVLLFYAAYGLVHALITRASGATLALDDVKLNVLTQSLRAGYLPGNPPLFEWLLGATQLIAGPTVFSFLIVKYALLVLAGILTYFTGRLLFNDDRRAGLAAFSLVLIYQIGWNYHQAFTHSTALIATVMLFWFSLLNLAKQRTVFAYSLFGVAIGLGMLAKYSFAAAVAIGVVAALRSNDLRKALLSPRLLVPAVIATFVMSPHLHWVLTANADIAATTGERLRGEEASYFSRIAEGLPQVFWAILSFGLPLVLFFAAPAKAMAAVRSAPDELVRVARDAAWLGAIALIAAVVAFGLGGMQERYAIAFLLPGLFWIISMVKPERFGFVLLAGLAITVSIAGVRVIERAVAGPPFCSSCRQWLPYVALEAAIDARRVEGATLVAYEDNTAGNLRRLYPSARVLSSHLPDFIPSFIERGAPCIFVWSTDLSEAPPTAWTTPPVANNIEIVRARWSRPFRDDDRITTWHVADIDSSTPEGATICRAE